VNVLVIPEDVPQDQWMLKPIIEALMSAVGKPRAKVDICRNPRLGSVNEALKWENISRIIAQYPWIDIFLLCIDRDQVPERINKLAEIEEQSANLLSGKRVLFGENAWQELEVWVLAGLEDLPPNWPWGEIRLECDPKETYFKPYVESRGLRDTPGEGRQILGAEAARNYKSLRSRCREDIQRLESRVKAWLESER
jgi:hypothetical protein